MQSIHVHISCWSLRMLRGCLYKFNFPHIDVEFAEKQLSFVCWLQRLGKQSLLPNG